MVENNVGKPATDYLSQTVPSDKNPSVIKQWPIRKQAGKSFLPIARELKAVKTFRHSQKPAM